MSLATLPSVPVSQHQLPWVVEQYISTFNQNQFEATAALFMPQGQLIPPLDPPITGPGAIRRYLQREATAMEIEVYRQAPLPPQGSLTRLRAEGKAKTPFFSVNVAWTFTFPDAGSAQLATVEIELLASWEELLQIRPDQARAARS